MLKTIKLLLPALTPSWRFFQEVAPSPRIEFSVLGSEGKSEMWQEFRPRPAHVPVRTMLMRFIWNAHWNESLFVMSCAERLIQNPTDHSMEEIARRIKTHLEPQGQGSFRFRLVFIDKEDGILKNHTLFVSPPYPYGEGIAL